MIVTAALRPFSNNNIHRVYRGRRVLTKAAKNWSQEAGLLLKLAGARPMTSEVWMGVSMELRVRVARRRTQTHPW